MSLSPFGMLMYVLILICLHFTVRPELVEGLTELPNLKNRHSGMDDRQGWRKCGKQVGTCAACRNPEHRDVKIL
jgi:hypothetical protein